MGTLRTGIVTFFLLLSLGVSGCGTIFHLADLIQLPLIFHREIIEAATAETPPLAEEQEEEEEDFGSPY